MGRKGHKSRRGVGESYQEPKAYRKVVGLTKTAFLILVAIMRRDKISASEAIERLLRSTGIEPTEDGDRDDR